jgi:hypothetical protein
MPGLSLKSMDVDALLSLRADIDKRLGQKRSELEQQLSKATGSVVRAARGAPDGTPAR